MSQKPTYDCIIVGAGPAGIFAALELIECQPELNVLLLEKGRALKRRKCPSHLKSVSCTKCSPCNITTGWGGAGAFSDGKLNLGKTMAGWLPEYIDQQTYEKYLQKVDDIWLKFGAPKKLYGVNEKVAEIKQEIEQAGFRTLIGPTRHLGTEKNISVLQKIYEYLDKKIEIKFNSQVRKLLKTKNKIKGVKLKNGTTFKAKTVMAAPGREGSRWFFKQAQKLDLTLKTHPVHLGVRVETRASVMRELTDVLYEAKLFYTTPTFGDKVRTFCMCPYGEVVQEQYSGFKGVVSVNGHSYGDKKTNNTNFALLVETNFTKPFDQPIKYGENVTQLANMLGENLLVQRLGDLLAGRRSTPDRIKNGEVEATLKTATPGDLSFALPYRHLTNIIEMIKQMERLAPGIFDFDTLLYGVEVKFYSSAPKLSQKLETEIDNLFAVGDGAGVTKNLVHASISGMVAAKEISCRLS